MLFFFLVDPTLNPGVIRYLVPKWLLFLDYCGESDFRRLRSYFVSTLFGKGWFAFATVHLL